MGDIYSPLKMAWWYARDGGLPDVPKQVQIILASLCNMSCHFCAYRLEGYSSNELFMGDSKPAKFGTNNPQRWMDTDRALALVQEIKDAGCLAIQWTGGGEISVHPHHEAILQKSVDLGLSNALVSNGLKWSDNLKRNILPKFSWVRVSIDAGTPVTFSKTRQTPIDSFDRVVANTTSLAGWIAAEKSACILGTGYVVTTENWTEITEGIRIAKSTGARYVRVAAAFSNDGVKPYEEIYDKIKASIAEAKARYEDSWFRVVDLFGERIQDLVDGHPEYKSCAKMWYNTYIGDDLRLYKCCVTSFSKWGILGSVADKTFGEAWKEAATDMHAHDSRKCPPCQFNSANRPLDFLMQDDPIHKEWP